MILTFPTFLPVNFQAAWGSLFHSSDITRGFHCLPHSSSRSLTIPPIFGSERKGIPDDDSKACAAEGILPTSVSMCVHGMSVKSVSMCTLHLWAENWVLIGRIGAWGIQSGYSWNKGTAYVQKKWHPKWRSLAIYNLPHLAAMTDKNALYWICTFLKWALFSLCCFRQMMKRVKKKWKKEKKSSLWCAAHGDMALRWKLEAESM